MDGKERMGKNGWERTDGKERMGKNGWERTDEEPEKSKLGLILKRFSPNARSSLLNACRMPTQ